MSNIIKFFKPNLKLVRGTRLTSGLFIGASIALAAGILWAANMYYDIDTSTVMVQEKQQVTGLFTATTTQITVDTGSAALTVTQTGTGAPLVLSGTATSTLGKIEVTAFKLTTNPASNYILTSDVSGYGTWQSPSAVTYWTQVGNNLYPSTLTWNVGIATSSPRYKLDVWGSAGFGTTTDMNTPVLLVDSYTQRIGIATSTPSAALAVNGDVFVKGDLKFSGDRTISGSGTLTINPTGNLYLQATTNYIDDSGNLVLAGYASTTKVISPELEYSGNITIDANLASGNTTVSVVNQDGTYIADLSVEGDITVTGGKVTLATGETIDAETTNNLKLSADNNILLVSNGVTVLTATSTGVKITGGATTSDTLVVTSGGAKITGNVIVQGDILPQAAGSGYTLGDSSTYWDNLYVSTTTIGSTGSQLVIDVDDIRAPGGLTITAQNGKIILATGTDVVLAGTGLFRVGSSGQFYIDASGNATTSGNIYASAFISTGSNAYTRKSGEQIVRGVAPIFGFDLPARCKTTCTTPNWATTTRFIENTDFFPPAYSGTTRKYRFSIRYATATTTATTRTTWQIATTSDNSSYEFTLPPTIYGGAYDLAKGFATTTNTISALPSVPWALRVRGGSGGNYDIQVYEVLLLGIDEVN